MKIKYCLLLLAVACTSAWCTYTVTRTTDNSDTAAHAESDRQDTRKAEIAGLRIEPAVSAEGWEAISATGRVTIPPDRLVTISPRIDGKVVFAHGTVGDSVKRGQVLAVISSVELAEARAVYRQSVAKLSAVRRHYERELQVAKLGAASMRPVEEARSEVLASQGELADATSELAQAQSEVARAESELVQCRSRLARVRELYADKIVSRQDLESAEAEYQRDTAGLDAAKAKVAQAQARVNKSESRLEISRQYLAREERVKKSRIVDQTALQNAEAAVYAAQVDLQAAADRIRVLGASPSGSGDTLTVVSPISGRIVGRDCNVGEMANPSSALFTVADLSLVWVEADIYEKDLARVRKGQVAEVRVDTYADRTFMGSVRSISDMLSAETQTARVRCVVSNAENLLRGGMFARVNLLIAKRGQTVLVPREAVLDDAGGKVVFTPCMECPEDREAGMSACGSYDKLTVKTGLVRGDRIEVTEGIEPGTPVVTTGAHQIKTAMSSGKLEAGCADH